MPVEDEELLARARRLCQAAREIQLPEILPRPAVVKERDEETTSSEKFPLIAAPKGSKSVKQGENASQRQLHQEEVHRQEQDRRKRALDKVKQAQERARARVARTNQLEGQQMRRSADLQREDEVSAAQQVADKIRRAQESRLRAKERIRAKCQQKNTGATAPSSACGERAETAALRSFHRKTVKRLQVRSNQQPTRSDKGERVVDTHEKNEDTDEDQKIVERRLRQETTARLRRMKQLAENQKRQAQEEFEQGLEKFKSKLRELDRVAKGLSKQPSLPQITESTAPESEETSASTCEVAVADTQCPSPVNCELVWSLNQAAESSSDSDASSDQERLNPITDVGPIEETLSRTAEAGTRKSKTRLPAWKQPPVPIQPTQCYSYKAILPTYSRASLTAPGSSTAATLGTATRFRAQEISRQTKSIR